ncbi:hypothetical protein AGMMS49592_0430 [Endomicrobiia bacterium]|nr:hypothetical protein AGMMS49592_0430 [Endomicrobiia bacterium]
MVDHEKENENENEVYTPFYIFPLPTLKTTTHQQLQYHLKERQGYLKRIITSSTTKPAIYKNKRIKRH